MQDIIIQELKKHVQLTPADEQLITRSFRLKKVKRNQFLVQPPDVAIYEHYVISGCLFEYYIDDDGIQHTLMFSPEGLSGITSKRSSLYPNRASFSVCGLKECVTPTATFLLLSRKLAVEISA